MRLGIVGYPLTYTQSPKLHRSFLKKEHREGSYDVLPFDPRKGKRVFHRFLASLAKQGYRGLNVTVPFKEWAYEFAVRAAPGIEGKCAQMVKACNTLIFTSKGALAANTDAKGLLDDLSAWESLRGQNIEIWVVGTGGSARGAIAGLLSSHSFVRRVASVKVWGRSPTRKRSLVKLLPKSEKKAPVDSALVLWCLPPLKRKDAKAIWEEVARRASSGRIYLYDLNYSDRADATLGFASSRRRKTGIGMLRRQARLAFDLW